MGQSEGTIPRGVGILELFPGPRTVHRTEVRSMDQMKRPLEKSSNACSTRCPRERGGPKDWSAA
jgi:hypothetical protein